MLENSPKHNELEKSGMSVEGNQNKVNSGELKELVEQEDIANTPFKTVGNPKQGYFIAIGRHRITEPKATKEEALELLESNKWEIVMNLIILGIEFIEEVKRQEMNKGQELKLQTGDLVGRPEFKPV